MTDMAIEFESVVEGDGIRIPEAYRDALARFAGPVLVTLRGGGAASSRPEAQNDRGYGCMKGQIWMSDDFDAPLEDFREYME
jgi:hypothetical protein